MIKHEVFGEGIGIFPGRVAWTHNPKIVNWNNSNFWWDLNNFDEIETQKLVDTCLMELTGEDGIKEAWRAIFKFHNKKLGKPNGYKSGEKIAIKVNMNGSGEFEDDYSGRSHMDYTNPVLMKCFLKSMVEAGIKPNDITVFDTARIFPDYFVKYCSEGKLNGIKFIGRNEGEIDYNTPVNWSKHFTKNITYLPTCLTEGTYLINLASLKAHFWGVTLLAKNHFGTIINENRFMPPVYAGIHNFVLNQCYGDYSVLVDLITNYQLGEKTILYGLDAIISTQTEGTNITKENAKWSMPPFNNDYTQSLFLSFDSIALDSVAIDFLTNEPAIIRRNSAPVNRDVDNYLHEASQIDNPPSGTVYLNGNNEKAKHFGVHEHWNNSIDKQYSRNLGKNEGIELIYKKI